MGILSYWLASLDYDYSILSHCSRHQSPRSTCRKCIDSCPEHAIQLHDEKPVIDMKQCTECGHCVASCPVQAVEGFLPKRQIINNRFIMDMKDVPTLKELLVYYKKGVTTMICKGQVLPIWEETLNDVNNVLEELGETPFRVIFEEAEINHETTISRRELFFSWEKDLKQIATKMTPAKWRFNHESLDVSKHYPDYQFVDVSLDTTKCTLCKACEILCKKSALSINEEGFTILANQCSNCALCQDICPEGAISLKQVVSSALPVSHQVHSKVCSECAETYETLNTEQDLCVACKKKKEFSMV